MICIEVSRPIRIELANRTNFALRDLDLYFQGQSVQVAILTSEGWNKAIITIAIRKEVMYSPSNGAIANVKHHDYVLHFKGHEIF